MTRLILASASPRRAELLQQIGVEFTVRPAAIDEAPTSGEAAVDYVRRMAREKAEAVAAQLDSGLTVLGADTSVVIVASNGAERILGKPQDRGHARQMLMALANRSHQVLSAVCMVRWQAGAIQHWQALSRSEVSFGPLAEAELDRYLASGEADDKAGAYGIQGRAAQFICHLSGSYSGVMGLPLFETVALMREAGVNYE